MNKTHWDKLLTRKDRILIKEFLERLERVRFKYGKNR